MEKVLQKIDSQGLWYNERYSLSSSLMEKSTTKFCLTESIVVTKALARRSWKKVLHNFASLGLW